MTDPSVQHHHSFDQIIFRWIHHGGYPVLFGLLLLCGVGLPLPEDIPLIAAGVFVQRGDFNLAIAAFSAWCGIIGGDCILYYLGWRFGEGVTELPFIGSHISKSRLKTVERYFVQYGIWVVAVGRLVAGVRGAMVVVAGASKFNFWKFIIADGLAAIVSGGLFMYIGYRFAPRLPWLLTEVVPKIKYGMLAGVAVLAAVLIAFVWRKNRARRSEGFAAVTPDAPTPNPSAPPTPGPV